MLFVDSINIVDRVFEATTVPLLFPVAIDILIELLRKPATFSSSRDAVQNKICFEQVYNIYYTIVHLRWIV